MTMTIKEAQDAFKRAKNDHSLDIRFDLVKMAIEQNHYHVFQNHSYYDALLLTMAMINHAQKSFFMFIGDGVENFIQQIETDFRAMLHRFRDNDGTAKIIVLSTEKKNLPSFDTMEREYAGAFTYRATTIQKENATDYRHFTIADGKMYRIEEPHEIITENSNADSIQAEVAFDNVYVVEYLKKVFDSYWKELENPA